VVQAANTAGRFVGLVVCGDELPRVQIITVPELLAGKKPSFRQFDLELRDQRHPMPAVSAAQRVPVVGGGG